MRPDPTKLRGKTALVTGAGRGLGRAVALRLAQEGVRVALVARHQPDVEAVAAEIRALGGTAAAFAADVGDKRAVHPLAAQIAEALGPVDLLVNNASTLGAVPLELLLDTECEELEAVLATNLVGPFRLTKLLAGPMVLRGEGLVVNLSSDAAVEAYPTWGAYSVSKAALDHLSRIFAAELEGTGVRFVAFDPGEMNTQMHADAVPDADVTQLADPVAIADRLVRLVASESVSEKVRWTARELGGIR